MRIFRRAVNNHEARELMEHNPQVFADILTQKRFIKDQPYVALKFRANTAIKKKKLNDFLKQVNKELLQFTLIKGIDNGIFFALIKLN